MSCVDENKPVKIFAALLVVAVCPSFFFQRWGKRICAAMTYFNGGVIGLTAVFQEPIVLTLNPLLALVGILLLSKKR